MNFRGPLGILLNSPIPSHWTWHGLQRPPPCLSLPQLQFPPPSHLCSTGEPHPPCSFSNTPSSCPPQGLSTCFYFSVMFILHHFIRTSPALVPNKFSLPVHWILTTVSWTKSHCRPHSTHREISQREAKGLALGPADLSSSLCHKVLLLLCRVGYYHPSALSSDAVPDSFMSSHPPPFNLSGSSLSFAVHISTIYNGDMHVYFHSLALLSCPWRQQLFVFDAVSPALFKWLTFNTY